jgi:hypothetical protein
LLEIANSGEPVQDGRIHIEKINWPMVHDLKASPVEYKAGLDLAIAKGWLWLHESGTCEAHPYFGIVLVGSVTNGWLISFANKIRTCDTREVVSSAPHSGLLRR